MRHRSSRLRLTQKPSHARMLKRNLVTSLLLYEKVRTTKKKAQVIQPMIDRLVTIAKTKPAHIAIRAINAVVTDKNASRKLMEVYKARYADRPSGLTRIKAAGARKGDGAPLVDISFVEGADAPAPTPEEKAEKKTTKKTTAKKSTTSSTKKTSDSSDS